MLAITTVRGHLDPWGDNSLNVASASPYFRMHGSKGSGTQVEIIISAPYEDYEYITEIRNCCQIPSR